MDVFIVCIIIALAFAYCVKRVIDKLKPGAPVCGSNCSCGSSPQHCQAMKIEKLGSKDGGV